MRIAFAGVVASSALLAACASEQQSVTAPEGVASFAIAPGNTVDVVTTDDIGTQPENTTPLNNWVFFVRAAATGAMRNGPASPPLGLGSYEIVTPTGTDKGTLFNYDHVGTPLSSITAIAYSTYRTAADNPAQVAAINLQVDVNGSEAGGFTTLVFEPVYNTNQGALVNGQWQSWDAYAGGTAIWWSSNNIPGAPNRDTFVPLSTIIALNPNAVIIGGVGINQGSGNPALTTAVDAFKLGYGGNSITYDFEQFRFANSAESCKQGGWKTLKRVDGSSFKNQGDCVAYVNTGK